VTTEGAPVTPLATLLPALGLPLPFGASLQSGLAFVDLEVAGPIDQPTATGKVTINNAKLVNFNLEDRLGSVTGMDVLHFGNDLAINHMTVEVKIGPEKMEMSNIETLLPELGTITGGGTIAIDRTLDFKLAVVRAGVSEKRPIPVLVRGAATSPVFR
jgi:autotransporter translocation and assembly factor TamB